MNILDYIILGLITLFGIRGIFRGFFKEISSLAGIIVGLLIGNHYNPQMADVLKAYIPLEKYLPFVSLITLFLLAFLFFTLLGILLHHLFKRLFIAWFDRSLGVIFALVKGMVISYLLIVLLTFFVPSASPLMAESKAARWVVVTYQSMFRLVSPDLYRDWKKKISEGSKKAGKIISKGKEAVKKIPEVLPEKKE